MSLVDHTQEVVVDFAWEKVFSAKDDFMKKTVFFGLLVIMLVISLIGCATVPSPGFDVKIEFSTETSVADISVETIWNKGLEGFSIGVNAPGIKGFAFSVKNLTDDVISIVWSKSALSYNGRSYVPFIDGQRYLNASSPESPMIIPANGLTNVGVYSSGQVNYDGQYGWNLYPIDANTVTIILCIESNNNTYNYNITVNSLQTN